MVPEARGVQRNGLIQEAGGVGTGVRVFVTQGSVRCDEVYI